MHKNNLHKIFSESDCLDEDSLFGYIDNKLTAKKKHEVELHILNCEFCADAIDGIRFINSTKHASESVKELNEKISSSVTTTKNRTLVIPIWARYAAAAAVILLFVSLFFIKQQLNKSDEIVVAKIEPKKGEDKNLETPPPPPPASEDKASEAPKDVAEKEIERNESGLRKESQQTNKGLLDKLDLPKAGPLGGGKASGTDNNRAQHLEQTIGWISDPQKDRNIQSAPDNFAQTIVSGNTSSSEAKPVQDQKNLVTIAQEKTDDITKIKKQVNTETLANNMIENKSSMNNSPVNNNTDSRTNNYKESEKFQSTGSVSDEEMSNEKIKGKKESKKKDKVTSATTKSNQQVPAQAAGGVSANEVLSEDKSIKEYNSAIGYYNQKDYASAVDAYEKLLINEPANYDAQYYLATCYYMLKNYEKAIKYYTDLAKLKNGKHYSDSKWYLSQSLVELKRTEQAKRVLREIIDEGGSFDSQAKQQLEKMK